MRLRLCVCSLYTRAHWSDDSESSVDGVCNIANTHVLIVFSEIDFVTFLFHILLELQRCVVPLQTIPENFVLFC